MENLKAKLYADSPYDLGTSEDSAYRDGVDATLEELQKKESA